MEAIKACNQLKEQINVDLKGKGNDFFRQAKQEEVFKNTKEEYLINCQYQTKHLADINIVVVVVVLIFNNEIQNNLST